MIIVKMMSRMGQTVDKGTLLCYTLCLLKLIIITSIPAVKFVEKEGKILDLADILYIMTVTFSQIGVILLNEERIYLSLLSPPSNLKLTFQCVLFSSQTISLCIYRFS